MHVSFIGMSGVGKSHWSKLLAQQGWGRLDCDAMIAGRLGDLVEVQPNEDAVIAVGRWMGMPLSQGYEQREEQYLGLEREATHGALDELRAQPDDSVVLDTTGSVIYLADDVLRRLKEETRVVYFEAPDSVLDEMATLYQREPKPLIWQGAYRPLEGEDRGESLARCYRGLLASRSTAYAALADVTIDYHAVRQADANPQALLELIWA